MILKPDESILKVCFSENFTQFVEVVKSSEVDSYIVGHLTEGTEKPHLKKKKHLQMNLIHSNQKRCREKAKAE